MSVKISTLVTWAILLIVIQLLITEWTVHVSGERTVVDFVSFAGTVVGIILAVLAIVYSYISSASQKDDASALRSQISSLNDTINRANASGQQFSSELSRLEQISADLSSIRANSEKALTNDEGIRKLIEERLTEKRAESSKDSSPVNSKMSNEALRHLVVNALPDQVVEYYLACFDDYPNNRKEYLRLVDELLASTFIRKNGNFWKAYERGVVFAYSAIFIDFGLYDDDAAMKAFKQELLARAESIGEAEMANVSEAFDKTLLTVSVQKVMSRLKEEVSG